MSWIILPLLNFVDGIGYVGLYVYMFLVGTFVPVPSELVLIPNGYLSSIDEKNYLVLLLCGAFGSLSGAVFNYYFALFIAKKFLRKKRILGKVTRFFKRHGKISVFLAPLTPGLGQYISIPAGLSRLSLKIFIPLTLTANLIWVNFMLLIGFVFGESKASHQKVIYLTLGLLCAVIITSSMYVFLDLRKKRNI
jgi:membrane protein DedA with SNARE-associated domain